MTLLNTKKGDMSMGVIIGAAIALLILVLLSVLIFRAGGQVSEGTQCEAVENAECIPEGETCGDYMGSGFIKGSGSCSVQGDVCCIPFG